MSRTSRRISRPLIAALAIVVVLGVVFTVHKVRKARAADAAKAVALQLTAPAPAPAKADKPAGVVVLPPEKVAPKSEPPKPVPSVESTALVTQTPTEKVSAPAAASPEPDHEIAAAPIVPSAPATPSSSPPMAKAEPQPEVVASSEGADGNDPAGLEQWAKGAKPVAQTPVQPSAPAPAEAATPAPALAHDVAPPVRAEISAQPVADAKAKMDAGDLITARQILNDSLIAGRGDADAIKKQIEQINETLVFSPRKFPDDPWGGSYQVASGERLGSIANRNSVTWELLSRINGITPKRLRSGQTIKVVKGPFYAIVTKHLFTMELYLGAPGGPGSMFIRTFQVGLGKDNSTPTGLWICKAGDKIRNPRYYPTRGGEVMAPEDPKNPLGGYWIAIEGLDGQALGKESYGIHGTIDPNSIGKMESMGCIRLRADDISWVFDLLVDGKSKVLVKD